MAFTLQQLADEINNDPLALGYKTGAVWKDDQVIVDLINALNYTIDVNSINPNDVRAATTYDAYDTLSIDEQEWIRWMTAGGGDEFGASGIKITADWKLQVTGRALAADGAGGAGNDSNSMWAAAHRGAMAPAFLALIERAGSRAEVLWGADTVISVSDVARAANV